MIRHGYLFYGRMNKDRYEALENKIKKARREVIILCRKILVKHPALKYPVIALRFLYIFNCRLRLYLAREILRLTDNFRQNRKEAVIFLLRVCLILAALVSVIEIIKLGRAQAKQQQDFQALQEEYISDNTVEEAQDETFNDAAQANEAEDDEDDPDAWYHAIDADIIGLREENPDIVGWLYFEDEDSISYPVLYSGDDYYLEHNYRREEETAGSIYIDGNNDPSLNDAHTLIYGHNMRNLSMFGKLKYYKTEEGYFNNHRYFQLITEDAAYRYEVFAYKDVSTLSGGIYTIWKYADDDFKEFVKDTIIAESYVDSDFSLGDDMHIVTLSTCSYDSKVRFTISAVRVDEHVRK